MHVIVISKKKDSKKTQIFEKIQDHKKSKETGKI